MLGSEFKVSLGYSIPCLKKKKARKEERRKEGKEERRREGLEERKRKEGTKQGTGTMTRSFKSTS